MSEGLNKLREIINKIWEMYCDSHRFDPFNKIPPHIFLIGMNAIGLFLAISVYFVLGYLFNFWDPVLAAIIYSIFFVYSIAIPFIFDDLRTTAIENELPDVLFTIATSVRAGSSLEMALADAYRISKGPIKEEIKKTIKEMKEGMTFEEAFTSFGERCRSKIVRRTASIIVTAKKSGGGLVDALTSISDDLRDFMRVQRERKTKTVMQAMFFVAAGIVIAPLIFGLVTTIAEFMGKQALSFTKPKPDDVLNIYNNIVSIFGLPPEKIVVNIYGLIFKLYLFTLAILSAIAVGVLREGKFTSGVKYIPIFLFISYILYLGAYFATKGFIGGA